MDMAGLFRLDGRTALVTGATRGIGRMIAAGFVGQGARVLVTGRDVDAAAATARDLGCTALPQDIATVAGCRALAERVTGEVAALDILVNNAGAAWGAPFGDFPEAGWDKVMDLNVKSPFFLTQLLHPLLKAAAAPDRPAKVINIASIDGLRINPWETYSYQASKAALIHLTRRLAARLAGDAIHVTAIAPGAFGTDMNKAARDHGDRLARAIPAGRIGRDEDMAAAAIYLASRAGDYVVGETIAVDGGLTYASAGAA